MPKRSNEFQRLVRMIHDAMASINCAKVTESAMVCEPDGTPREIDILIEGRVADVDIRVAVECRDRSRKSDVEWIDGLIGKFKNLKIEKVIAVSRSGFSSTATRKASAANIELRTLEQCLDSEWPNEFLKLGFAIFEFNPWPNAVTVTIDPEPPDPIAITSTVIIDDGTTRTVAELVTACLGQVVFPQIKAYIEREFLSKGLPLATLTRKWELTIPVVVKNAFILTEQNTRHQLTKFVFDIIAESKTTSSHVKHLKYGTTALASIGDLHVNTALHRMEIVQIAGTKQLTVKLMSGKG